MDLLSLTCEDDLLQFASDVDETFCVSKLFFVLDIQIFNSEMDIWIGALS